MKGKRRQKRRSGLVNFLVFSMIVFTAVGVYVSLKPDRQMERLARLESSNEAGRNGEKEEDGNDGLLTKPLAEFPEWIDTQLIEVDGTSRRGEELEAVRDIVIHYVGNPGTTAQQNRDYFSNPDSDVSAHFVVGLDGEIIQCVPLTEKSSASNERNKDTISIEVCHPDETGVFNRATYESLVKLTDWLCDVTGLKTNRIIRHYDITGKLCPLYYVENEDEWERFLRDVKYYDS